MRGIIVGTMLALAAGMSFSVPSSASDFAVWSAVEPRPAVPAELKLRDWQGRPRDLREFRGKVVLVNFWASWCEPCREEMPELEELREQYGDKGLEVVAVNLGESERRIQSFVKAFMPDGMSFVILQDRDSLAYKQWQVRALPTSYLLDRSGMLRWQAFGKINPGDELTQKRIEELLSH